MISNHVFVNGNKRIGMYIMFTFLEDNGKRIFPNVEEVVHVRLAVASCEMKYEEQLEWVRENK